MRVSDVYESDYTRLLQAKREQIRESRSKNAALVKTDVTNSTKYKNVTEEEDIFLSLPLSLPPPSFVRSCPKEVLLIKYLLDFSFLPAHFSLTADSFANSHPTNNFTFLILESKR